jgi:predicted DNA-binding transcriptional regulator YafY
MISDFTVPKESIVLSAVKTVKVGDKSKKVTPIVPGTTANETMAVINQYIEEQSSLMISYADTNGGVSNRIVHPISVSLGTLTARDHVTGELTQFRIPRINGVAPAPAE